MNKLIQGAMALLLTVGACSSQEAGEAAGSVPPPHHRRTAAAQTVEAPPRPTTTAAADGVSALPEGVQALLTAYPDCIKDFKEGNLVMADGTTIPYDDGRKKEFTVMLDNADPEDMFYVPYRVPDTEPEYLEDAGRSRSEVLFKTMYGNSGARVQSQLVSVPWFGQSVKFSKTNGAADSLRAVARDLAQYPELRKYLKSSGTFYWRTVRGATRQSAHSYGIAFDIGVDHSDYWLWKNRGATETTRIKYANRIPRKIVEIFQRHGFVWGGSWYHYDTMHFEFRPELLEYARIHKQD